MAAGPYGAFLVGKSFSASVNEKEVSSDVNDVRSWDMGLTFAAGSSIALSSVTDLIFGARYELGLINLNTDSKSGVSSRNLSWLFHSGVAFAL